MATSRHKAKGRDLEVVLDNDGGVTLRDRISGVVLSIIGTHPDANGPKGLIVEANAWESDKEIAVEDTPPDLLRNPRNPVRTYYTDPETT